MARRRYGLRLGLDLDYGNLLDQQLGVDLEDLDRAGLVVSVSARW